jgi:hypothetical protein
LKKVAALGLGTTDHVVPFQDSIRVSVSFELPQVLPTAKQSDELRQYGSESSLNVLGLGLGIWDHTLVAAATGVPSTATSPMEHSKTATGEMRRNRRGPEAFGRVGRVAFLGSGQICFTTSGDEGFAFLVNSAIVTLAVPNPLERRSIGSDALAARGRNSQDLWTKPVGLRGDHVLIWF